MAFSVSVATAVDRLNKKVSFLQPLFESISNSLEAGATSIAVNFDPEPALPDIMPKIIGFSVTDNGAGFTEKNRCAFNELWTTNKISMGCKGFGRLTWLRVFDKISIKSFTADEEVDINFTKDFDDKKDIAVKASKNPRKTTITFSGVTDKFFKPAKNEKETPIDQRPAADLPKLVDIVEKHLLVKLSLLKKEDAKFSIKFNLHGQHQELNDGNITELFEQGFAVEGMDKKEYPFKLYYNFIANGGNQRDLFYCANSRTVMKFQPDVSLENLPANDSVIMLLCSDYLDERTNNERTQFTISVSDNNATLTDPVAFPTINTMLKNKVQGIVLEKYPEIVNDNAKEVQAAIDEAPHLAKYIRTDDSIVKSKNSLIETARVKYEKEKGAVRNKFATMLEKKDIEPKAFFKTIGEVSDIAARELGEYIGYRQQIIEGLKKFSANDEQVESLIHDLFMKMKTVSKPEDGDMNVLSAYDSNLWLLDDKFLSYSYAASDKKINKVLKDNGLDKDQENGGQAPDLAMFYSGKEDSDNLSCVLVEIKPFGIPSAKKFIGLRQVKEYARVFYTNNPKIKNFWVYMVTKIDAKFAKELETDGYTPLYSNAEGHKIFVRYFDKETPPIYLDVICVDAIIEDADARNKVFLNILKQS